MYKAEKKGDFDVIYSSLLEKKINRFNILNNGNRQKMENIMTFATKKPEIQGVIDRGESDGSTIVEGKNH
ncbi:hypothetical protein LG296_15525 [Ureibacillus chungkukjangi]|uniref:hypothetical protein n=1 Tax=Ureibacillus chungkukjangi TaxID=1202712 RepID=UPI00384B06E6